jgi:uncharacterized cupredoxin-like copper-binding protein
MSAIESRSAPSPHRMPAIALVGIILIAALVATGTVLAASSGAAPAKRVPAASRVGVTMKEFTIAPRPATGKAGSVTFRVRNAGKIKHEFVVLRTPKSASKLLKGSEASEAGNVGEIGNLPAGSTKSLTLKLKAGHYALICNLSGHYKAGQHADFVVK